MRTSARAFEAKIKRHKALAARTRGLTLREIALEVGYATPSGARRAIEVALRESASKADIEEARQIELERLDLAVRAVMPAMDNGDLKAVDMFVRISERRSKLKGLDATTPPVALTVDMEQHHHEHYQLDNTGAAGVIAAWRAAGILDRLAPGIGAALDQSTSDPPHELVDPAHPDGQTGSLPRP